MIHLQSSVCQQKTEQKTKQKHRNEIRDLESRCYMNNDRRKRIKMADRGVFYGPQGTSKEENNGQTKAGPRPLLPNKYFIAQQFPSSLVLS